jgi:mannosyl-oligosaccharide alpha-1,2-mannosidase
MHRRLHSPEKKIIRGIGLTIFLIVFVFFFRNSFFHSQLEFNFVPIPIRPERYPVPSNIPLPRGTKKIPKIQHAPVVETVKERRVREQRLGEVREAFLHAWGGYKKEAWAKDELMPINGGFKTPFCGWAATLVDTLDTLWIMELYAEFELALAELKNVDFTHKEGCQINLFETTIRHLGGMLAAWDLSGGKYPILVEKSVELAEVLYTAFDTENRMPTPHYTWSAYVWSQPERAMLTYDQSGSRCE